MKRKVLPHPAIAWRVAIVVVVGGITTIEVLSQEGQQPAVPRHHAQHLGDLASQRILESSGLAASHRSDAVLWTHNDSGDAARVYALDMRGGELGAVDVVGAEAVDWEDMASFERDGRSYLLLADVGDNARRRDHGTLYLVEEPEPGDTGAQLAERLRFNFAGGPRDCEAVGYDPTTNSILLVAKERRLLCSVYQLAWPAEPTREILTAQPIARLPMPLVTAMDVSSDGRRAVVATYGDAMLYDRQEGEDWAQAFARAGRLVPLPPRRQGEAVCFSTDASRLFVTSEGVHSPLWTIPLPQ